MGEGENIPEMATTMSIFHLPVELLLALPLSDKDFCAFRQTCKPFSVLPLDPARLSRNFRWQCIHNHQEIVETLLSRHGNLVGSASDKSRLVTECLQFGAVDVCMMLITRKGRRKRIFDENFMTMVCCEGFTEILKFVLDCRYLRMGVGCNNVLVKASMVGNGNVVKMLLEHPRSKEFFDEKIIRMAFMRSYVAGRIMVLKILKPYVVWNYDEETRIYMNEFLGAVSRRDDVVLLYDLLGNDFIRRNMSYYLVNISLYRSVFLRLFGIFWKGGLRCFRAWVCFGNFSDDELASIRKGFAFEKIKRFQGVKGKDRKEKTDIMLEWEKKNP